MTSATFISDDLVLFCFVIIKSRVSSFNRFSTSGSGLSSVSYQSRCQLSCGGLGESLSLEHPISIQMLIEIFLVEDAFNIRAVSPQTDFLHQALDCFL